MGSWKVKIALGFGVLLDECGLWPDQVYTYTQAQRKNKECNYRHKYRDARVDGDKSTGAGTSRC